jgi:hypothetical protein
MQFTKSSKRILECVSTQWLELAEKRLELAKKWLELSKSGWSKMQESRFDSSRT